MKRLGVHCREDLRKIIDLGLDEDLTPITLVHPGYWDDPSSHPGRGDATAGASPAIPPS
ncbi:MAG: hypothetical protein K0R38_485 [Polyangiaceae bacterium]|jgi:hypothetical protein|nr:hypothetical protein [Polyangiaceae bacterium]